MPDPLTLQLNGQKRVIEQLTSPSTLDLLILSLQLKTDRIAVEHNGAITPRSAWSSVAVHNGDRLEIVHFVGGGRT